MECHAASQLIREKGKRLVIYTPRIPGFVGEVRIYAREYLKIKLAEHKFILKKTKRKRRIIKILGASVEMKVKASYLYSETESFTVCTESHILLRFARTADFRPLLINHSAVSGRAELAQARST